MRQLIWCENVMKKTKKLLGTWYEHMCTCSSWAKVNTSGIPTYSRECGLVVLLRFWIRYFWSRWDLSTNDTYSECSWRGSDESVIALSWKCHLHYCGHKAWFSSLCWCAHRQCESIWMFHRDTVAYLSTTHQDASNKLSKVYLPHVFTK